MRALVFSALVGFAGVASATTLNDANAAFASKDYQTALKLYTVLADKGNADAQLRLGEMFWYGEGAPLDRSRGDALFARAAAAGNKEAVNNLSLTAQRRQKADGIAYWTSTYQGADLASAKLACAAPVVPASSADKQEIERVSAAMNAWRSCYNDFVANIGNAMLGKRIPLEIAVVMSEAELRDANARLDDIYRNKLIEARSESSVTVARYDRWLAATEMALGSRILDNEWDKNLLAQREYQRSLNAGPSVAFRK